MAIFSFQSNLVQGIFDFSAEHALTLENTPDEQGNRASPAKLVLVEAVRDMVIRFWM